MPKQAPEHDATAAASVDPETALDTAQTGKIVGLAPITLTQRRMRGDGPPFFRVGRSVRYRLGDVLAFRDANTVGKKVAK